MAYREIKGDIIKLALEGEFDIIAHGVNCFNTQKAGLAPQMVKAFGTDTFELEGEDYKGDFNKLGQIDYEIKMITTEGKVLTVIEGIKNCDFSDKALQVINCYTQHTYGKSPKGANPLDYDALRLCLRKIAHTFHGHIGLPKIGCGLAGGDWDIVKKIIIEELKGHKVTIVHFKK